MPRSILSDAELETLLNAILREGGCEDIDDLLRGTHEFKTFGKLMPYERYFAKLLAYDGFEFHIRRFVSEEGSVQEVDMQFKRPSGFALPFFNRNRRVFKRLLALTTRHFNQQGVVVKDEAGGSQLHFNPSAPHHVRSASAPFEDWGSECAIYDEPRSSGQTSPEETEIRNDFIIFRYRRFRANYGD